ncbi:MAG: ATPase [Firmicutes bacterium]|nr:ATPase [Bacillota bacterium]
MARLSVMILLDRLEELLAGGFRLVGRSRIDAEAALELTQKIRAALPDEIRQAEWLTSEKERLLFEAQEEAKRILRDAENYAAKLVQESQIVRRAEQQAEEILAEARREAAAIEEEAKKYARHLLSQLEENLERALRVVRKGREELNEEE